MKALARDIFKIDNDESFNRIALDVFRFQAENLPVYKEYLKQIGRDPSSITSVDEIPFLPIELYKHHEVIAKGQTAEITFESSGTTGQIRSKHPVADLSLYHESAVRGFEHFFGSLDKWAFFGLLPSYLERQNASLVHMVQHFIQTSGNQGGFYLNEFDALEAAILAAQAAGLQPMIFGVTFALLDWAEKCPANLRTAVVVETGGMKGRGHEPTREQVHALLQKGLGLSNIASEYGMTELLSQAYSPENGLFLTPPWMKLLLREVRDPFTKIQGNGSGLINVIDLANLYSCSFIATMDVGRISDHGMEVLGRADAAEMRGCNLLV